MQKFYVLLVFLITSSVVFAQEEQRQLLRGQVLYRNTNVPNEYVVNSTAELSTITGEDGRFAIEVKEGDELVFAAVNYQLKVVKITPEILKNNRLVVEVEERVRELDEVVVSPENQEKFLEVKNEEFKEFEYEIDRSTEVQNVAQLSQNERIEGRINFVNIFKAIFKGQESAEGEKITLKVSQVLRSVYDDEFFMVDLKLPQDKIDAFLYYVDEKVPSRTLLKKENEFQLLDFLVTESKNFMAELED